MSHELQFLSNFTKDGISSSSKITLILDQLWYSIWIHKGILNRVIVFVSTIKFLQITYLLVLFTYVIQVFYNVKILEQY